MNIPKITIISTQDNKLPLADVPRLTPVLTDHGVIILPTGKFTYDVNSRECFVLNTMSFVEYRSDILVKEIEEIEIKVTPKN
jgi:hypothetical protein